ncbi:hypothetical protein ZHAS_00010603 [Anopheles sinensis]|uniref:Uncharacterized protein n=1 Tax=Anopheles sinensis TaxID=74873 RepID=A0A084VY07_ANOSI|nr:hypothetical protein ZHAS_00010603 [Anopheles sinensis]
MVRPIVVIYHARAPDRRTDWMKSQVHVRMKRRTPIRPGIHNGISSQGPTPPLATCFLLFLLGPACHLGASAKGIKQKRLVIDLSDPLLTVTDPSVYFGHPTTTTYSSGPAFYAPSSRASFAPYGHGHQSTRVVSPLKPASLFNGNLFQYSNYGSPFPFLSGNHLSLDGEETYIADGRILKQYAVMEFHAEERERDLHHQQQHLLHGSAAFRAPATGTLPYPSDTPYFNKFPTPYDPLYAPTGFAPQLPQLPQLSSGFNPRFGVQHNDQRSPLLTKNHGPIALGSGSLGYIHGPNGVTVGSGSLGYISHQQHRETLAELIERKKSKHLPSPLTFGHNHN